MEARHEMIKDGLIQPSTSCCMETSRALQKKLRDENYPHGEPSVTPDSISGKIRLLFEKYKRVRTVAFLAGGPVVFGWWLVVDCCWRRELADPRRGGEHWSGTSSKAAQEI